MGIFTLLLDFFKRIFGLTSDSIFDKIKSGSKDFFGDLKDGSMDIFGNFLGFFRMENVSFTYCKV